MKIRKYKENDCASVLEIYTKSKLDELAFESVKFELLPLENDTKRLAQLKESDIYICEDNGVVGFGAVHDNEIRALFVHPNARGRGLGRNIFEYLLSKVSGITTLYVAKTNSPAKRLYKSYGFYEADEFETNYNGVPVIANKMLCPSTYSTI